MKPEAQHVEHEVRRTHTEHTARNTHNASFQSRQGSLGVAARAKPQKNRDTSAAQHAKSAQQENKIGAAQHGQRRSTKNQKHPEGLAGWSKESRGKNEQDIRHQDNNTDRRVYWMYDDEHDGRRYKEAGQEGR